MTIAKIKESKAELSAGTTLSYSKVLASSAMITQIVQGFTDQSRQQRKGARVPNGIRESREELKLRPAKEVSSTGN